jgi:hypothetical protein
MFSSMDVNNQLPGERIASSRADGVRIRSSLYVHSNNDEFMQMIRRLNQEKKERRDLMQRISIENAEATQKYLEEQRQYDRAEVEERRKKMQD